MQPSIPKHCVSDGRGNDWPDWPAWTHWHGWSDWTRWPAIAENGPRKGEGGICVDWGRYRRWAQRLRLRSGMIDFVRLPIGWGMIGPPIAKALQVCRPVSAFAETYTTGDRIHRSEFGVKPAKPIIFCKSTPPRPAAHRCVTRVFCFSGWFATDGLLQTGTTAHK